MAAEPMPLETEFTITVSPMRRPPRVKSMCHAVPNATCSAAGVVVGDLLGHADQLPGGRDRVLREAAGTRDAEEDLAAEQVRHDAVADREVVDPLADRIDPADDLEALDVGEVDGEARRPLADVDVDVVQRARRDVDAHMAGARLRIVDVLDGEHVGPSELAHVLRLSRRVRSLSSPVDYALRCRNVYKRLGPPRCGRATDCEEHEMEAADATSPRRRHGAAVLRGLWRSATSTAAASGAR